MKKFAVIVPIGPGAEELRRYRDFLDSLWHYEPSASLCVAIDSSPFARSIVPSRQNEPCRFVTLNAPFRGQGEPLMGRLSASLLKGLEIIRRAGPVDFVLRADTDALITGRFRETISRFLHEHPQTGIVGTLGFTCRRDSPHYGCEKTSLSDVVTALARLPGDAPEFRAHRSLICRRRGGMDMWAKSTARVASMFCRSGRSKDCRIGDACGILKTGCGLRCRKT